MRFRLDVSTGPDSTRSSAQMSTFRSQTALVRCGRIRSNHVRSRGSQERTGSGEPIADSGRGWRATRPQHRSARPAPVHGKGAVLHQANSEGCALPAIRSGRVDRREGTNQYPLMTDSDQRLPRQEVAVQVQYCQLGQQPRGWSGLESPLPSRVFVQLAARL